MSFLVGRVIRRRFEATDEKLALRIAGLMHEGAADELAQIIDDLRHGRPIKI